MTGELFGLALLGVLAFAAAARAVLAPLDRGPHARLAFGLAAASLAAVCAIYLAVGRPGALGPPTATADDPAEEMARSIVAKLEAQPGDATGWRMLGGVRGMQGRYAEASVAFAKARELSGDQDVGALVGYAEAQVLEDPARLAAMAPLFARALELEPGNPRALWYAGHAAAEAGDKVEADALWTTLLAQDIPEGLRAAVRERLGAPAAGAVLLEVEVAIAPALAARAAPGAPLFVFVRAPGASAPMLVKRIAEPRFPQRVEFTAADRLGAAVPIAPGFSVGARLSKLGTAPRGSGDLEGAALVAAGGKVALTLDGVVP